MTNGLRSLTLTLLACVLTSTGACALSNDNLWPLPHDDARRKAALEEQLYLELSAGETTQAHAIDLLLSWD